MKLALLLPIALLIGCASKPHRPEPMDCYEKLHTYTASSYSVSRFANERGNNDEGWWEQSGGRCGTLTPWGTTDKPYHVYVMSQDRPQDFAFLDLAMAYLNEWCPVHNPKYAEGSISHVTPAQWQAAQGLYGPVWKCTNGEYLYRMTPNNWWVRDDHPERHALKANEGLRMICLPWDDPRHGSELGDTFPPSGDAK